MRELEGKEAIVRKRGNSQRLRKIWVFRRAKGLL